MSNGGKQTAAHTPGPWRVESGTALVWGNCNPDDHTSYGMGYPIIECRINPSGNWSAGPYADEAEANARLIAAAPDLLEALEAMLEGVVGARADEELDCTTDAGGYLLGDVMTDVLEAARAAIAKATGEQP